MPALNGIEVSKALLSFVAEFNLPNVELDSQPGRPAQWLHAGMLISVGRAGVSGTPVIVFEYGRYRRVIPLADAETETLRSCNGHFST